MSAKQKKAVYETGHEVDSSALKSIARELDQSADRFQPESIVRLHEMVRQVKTTYSPQGLVNLSCLSQALEMTLLRIVAADHHQNIFSPQLQEALAQSVRKLARMIDNPDQSDQQPVNDELNSLDPFLRGPLPIISKGSSQKIPEPIELIDPEPLSEAEPPATPKNEIRTKRTNDLYDRLFRQSGESVVTARRMRQVLEDSPTQLLHTDSGEATEHASDVILDLLLSHSLGDEGDNTKIASLIEVELKRLAKNILAPFSDPIIKNPQVEQALQAQERSVVSTHQAAAELCLEPATLLLAQLRRKIALIGSGLGRKLLIVTEGERILIDLQLQERLYEPLAYAARILVQRSIEDAEGRIAADKSENGLISIKISERDGAGIQIELLDDGCGLDQERISSAKPVCDILAQYNGRLSIERRQTGGMRLIFLFPHPASVIRVLLVAVGGDQFLIPSANIVDRSPDGHIAAANVYIWRNARLPLVRLADIMDSEFGDLGEECRPLIVRSGNETFALLVDTSGAEHESVTLQPVSRYLRSSGLYSGASITGDGDAVLALNTSSLLRWPPVSR